MSEEIPAEEQLNDMQLLEKHAMQLTEHFDTVQIFVTKHDSSVRDGTVNANFGRGNWFARYGQVRQWIGEMEVFEP